MLPLLRRWRFPLLLAAALIILEILLTLFIQSRAGADRVWLGDYVWNTSDQAVYLTYIEEAKRGAIFFHSLYAPPEAKAFIHPAYVPIGWIAWLGHLTAQQAHEVGRWLVTLIATLLFHSVTRALTKTEREASIATATITLGGGLGWMLVVHQGMQGFFPHEFFVPDVSSESFFFPTLLGGAHIPLSMALLVYSLHRLWQDISVRKASWQSIASTSALFLIHPYFVPVIGLYGLITILVERVPLRSILRLAASYLPFAVLTISPHVWSYLHDPYRRFLLDTNFLNLAPFTENLFSVLPWLGFIVWRFRRDPLQKKERWILVWIATTVLIICIPSIHFKRKILEGTGVGVMLLALPVWFRVLAWAKRTGKIAHVGMWTMIILSPFSIIQSQLAWVTKPMGNGDEFFVSKNIANAWEWIRQNTDENALILPDQPWVGLWIAPNTLRHVWIAHDYETPHWDQRKRFLQDMFVEKNSARVQAMLKETGADFLVTSSQKNGIFISQNTSSTWSPAANFGEVTIWKH